MTGSADDRAARPTIAEVDEWAERIARDAARLPVDGEPVEASVFTHAYGVRHDTGGQYIRFGSGERRAFYGYWQPPHAGPATLLVHVPGYGAEMSAHPELVAAGYAVLHINPLGYATPSGPQESLKVNGDWPVLPETLLTGGRGGYRDWLTDALLGIRWAMNRPEVLPGRVSFFGTSQGGGGALLLASLLRGGGVRCVAADEPFLTDFPGAAGRGAYGRIEEGLARMPDPRGARRALAFVDTLSHAHRLNLPVLLTAGGSDETCPPETVETLFAALPATRSLTFLEGVAHGYTREFLPLAAAWFRLYA